MKTLLASLGGDNDALDDLKTKSGELRQHEITADEYFNFFIELFGQEQSLMIFPRVICTVPDEEIQKELFGLYRELAETEPENLGVEGGEYETNQEKKKKLKKFSDQEVTENRKRHRRLSSFADHNIKP